MKDDLLNLIANLSAYFFTCNFHKKLRSFRKIRAHVSNKLIIRHLSNHDCQFMFNSHQCARVKKRKKTIIALLYL